MQAVCRLYRELEVTFPWQAGDVLMVDNISPRMRAIRFPASENFLLPWVNYEAMQTSQTSTDEVPSDVDHGFRLSYQQARIWSIPQAKGTDTPSTVVPTAQCGLRIEGKLDVPHLRAALQRVVDRHESCARTLFERVTPGSLSRSLRQLVASYGVLLTCLIAAQKKGRE